MAITHTFVNPKADGGDATITRPSDWNANHTIGAGTITYAQLDNSSTADPIPNLGLTIAASMGWLLS